MSAAFPESNPFEARRAIKIEERGTIVPSFYARHERDGAGIVVMSRGVPLVPSFTVDRVPPERRWAIRPNGELLDQAEFEALLVRVYDEGARAYSSDGKTAQGNPRLNAIPRVERYVAVELDPRNPRQFIPMGYVAHPTTDRKIPDRFFDSSGEPVDARPLDVLLDAYFEPRLRPRMKAHEVEAVETHLRAQRERAMAEAKGHGSHNGTAPCGKTGLRNVGAHKAGCHKCRELAAQDDAAAAG